MHPRHHTYYIYWLHINLRWDAARTHNHIDRARAAGRARRESRGLAEIPEVMG